MARVIMTPGETVYVGGAAVTVFGLNDGAETVHIVIGNVTLDGSFARGGDSVVLPGDANDYTVRLLGQTGVFTNGPITVSVPAGLVGTSILFDDVTLTFVAQPPTGIFLGTLLLTGTPQPPLPSGTLELDADTIQTAASTLISGYDTVLLGTARDEPGADGHFYIITLDNDNAPTGNVLTIDGSALAADTDGAGPLTAETATINGAFVSAFNLNITTGEAADTVYLGLGTDTVDTGAGFDIIYAGIGLTASDNVDGGAGGAGMFLTGSYGDAAFTGVRNVGTLGLLTQGSTLQIGANAAAAGVTGILDASAGSTTINAAGYSQFLLIDGGAGGDTISLGNVANTLAYGELSDSNGLTGRDTIFNFVSGFDRIDVRSIDTPTTLFNIEFLGNYNGFFAAQAALDPFNFDIDVVFDSLSNTLWFDLDDNFVLDNNDLSIVLPGVVSIQGVDVYDGAAHFG